MVQFSMPMYEMILKEILGSGGVVAKNSEEKVVELQWKEFEILFRFTPCFEKGKLGLRCLKMNTFRDGVLVSNDFDAQKLKEML